MICVNVVVEGEPKRAFLTSAISVLFKRNTVVTPDVSFSGGSVVRSELRNYAQPKWDIRQ